MTESSNRPRVPGTTLLKIARLLFDESLLSAAVQPTISDLQREVADAGSSRLKRLRAQRRGYCAFWTLTLVASFASFASCAPGASPARAHLVLVRQHARRVCSRVGSGRVA